MDLAFRQPEQLPSPPCPDPRLVDFIDSHRRIFVLSGAGCSTGSGIPDYRDERGDWKRAQPMTWQVFTADPAARRRYWARSLVGWPRMGDARPNTAHHALARLEDRGHLALLLTQNVDGLHQRAGSRAVIDLHGRLDTVVCLACHTRFEREPFQQRLHAMNPGWSERRAELLPDGDAALDETDFSGFEVPACERCGGVLKPDVVFFGESVPRTRIAQANAALESSDAMLVVGSSLMVFSGFRFARRAAELGLPLASVTLGRGRADELLTLKIEAPCGKALAFLDPALSA